MRDEPEWVRPREFHPADGVPFWRAVLGYRDRDDGGEDLIDVRGRGPMVWFQQMDAVKAGGRLVTDAHAPAWWTLADAEGNEADACAYGAG